MANFFEKQPASRPITYQNIAYGGNATSVPSTSFGRSVQHIRLVSEVQGFVQIGDGVALAAVVGSSSMKIAANQAGEYFAVTPGQMVAFNSTSTSTGYLSITEMS